MDCPTCFRCHWDCVYNQMIDRFELQHSTKNENNLPCCKGTPTSRPSSTEIEICDIENDNDKRKNKGK